MSNNVDNRIVNMEFNNQEFERRSRQSIRTLQDLRSGLQLDGSARSLQNLSRVANTFSLQHISDGASQISNRLSNMSIIGITAIQNLTNRVVDAGIRMGKALTIEPISTGFTEYETKMNAIQTILTNTKSKGTTLDDVNSALNELNTYADQTIYNFAEMTRNIGTFTAAGIDLKTSTESIKGIANLAAGSGSSAEQASTAMYQLSQALAAGSVKLMDWNSVVNAGMGGELFQNALKKTAKSMGKFVDETLPFRQTLEQGWLTSDVLTATLSEFAKDEDLLKAATNVTTFTKLMDTMKESVQSGWAVTWEQIIGNKAQSTAFFTAISNGFSEIVGASADARNATLKFWNQNGGREALIKGLAFGLMFLSDVLRPVGTAFREIFQPVTAKLLVTLSEKFRDFMAGLKVSEETGNKLKSTFRGVFAIFDIVKDAVFALGKIFIGIIKFMSPLFSGILTVTASLGEFIVAMRNAAKESGVFNKIIGFSMIFVNMIGNVFERAKERLKSFGAVGEAINELFTKIKSKFEKTSGVVGDVGNKTSKLTEIMTKLKTALSEAFKGASFETFLDIFNGGVLAAILISIKLFIGNIKKVVTGFISGGGPFSGVIKSFQGVLDGVQTVLGGVRQSLQAFQTQIKAKALMTIATAIAVLAVSLIALSLIDSQKLAVALGAMTGLFVNLFGSMIIFQKLMGGTAAGTVNFIKIGSAMIVFSVAVLILASAMKKLSDNDWTGVGMGLVSLAGLLGFLAVSMKLMSKNTGILLTTGVALIAFSVAVNILADAIKKISDIEDGKIIKGMVGLAGIVAILKLLTTLKLNQKDILLTALSITALSLAMDIYAKSLKSLGGLSPEEIGMGILGIAGILVTIGAAINNMPKHLLVTGSALLIIGYAIAKLGESVLTFSKLSIEEIYRGVVTLGSSLLILSVASNSMVQALPGAAAILVLAAALLLLTPTIVILSQLPLAGLGVALLALAGTFLIIGLAGAAMTPIIPVLFALGVSLALLGVAAVGVGVGLLALTKAFAILVAIGTGGGLIALYAGIKIIPAALKELALGVINFVKTLGENAGKIASSVLAIGVELLKSFTTMIPQVVEVVFKFIKNILDLFIKYAPSLVETGITLITSLLEGVEKNIDRLVVAAVSVVAKFISGLTKSLPILIDSGVKMIIVFVNGVSDAIDENVDTVTKAMERLVETIIRAGIKAALSGTVGVGKAIVLGVYDGIKSYFGIGESAGAELGGALEKGTKKALEIRSPSRKFYEIGQNSVFGMVAGVNAMRPTVVTSGQDLAGTFMDSTAKALKREQPKKSGFDIFGSIGVELFGATSQKPEEVKAIKDTGTKSGAALMSGAQNGIKSGSSGVSSAVKSAFDTAMEQIEERKYYNTISLKEELEEYEKMQTKYKEGSTERKKLDREVYRVKKAILKEEYDTSINWIEDKKYYNKLSLQEELDAWTRIQSRYLAGTEERKKADREVYSLQKELREKEKEEAKRIADIYNNLKLDKQSMAKERFEDAKFYNKLTLHEELAMQREIYQGEDFGSKERKEASKEILRLEREIRDKTIETRAEILDVEEQANKDKITLEEEYYAKTVEINTKLKDDAKALKEEYVDAIKQRANALYNSVGLFDKFEKKQVISGKETLENLKQQVIAFDDWRKDIARLAKRGIDEGLLKELTDMGPQAADKIAGLVQLSDYELNQLQKVWQQKHQYAKEQATLELDDLRAKTTEKIQKLEDQAAIDLEKYNVMWLQKQKELKTKTLESLDALKLDFETTVGKLSSETVTSVETMVTGIQEEIKKPDWSKVGGDMMLGMKAGVVEKAVDVANAAAAAAKAALQAAKDAMAKDAGLLALESMQSTLSKISDFVNDNVDSSPVIKPVLDLSAVSSGGKQISGMFSGINVAATASNLPIVGTSKSDINNQNGSKSGTSVAFTQINNSPKALSRLEIYRQTKNQLATLKGLVNK